MTDEPTPPTLNKLPSGIPDFDFIAQGGLPENRVTLLAGSVGSGKTVFGCQFLEAGVRDKNEGAVFVTFEESPQKIRQNMAGLGIDIPARERQGAWAFVDMTSTEALGEVQGTFDLGAFLPRIEYAIRKSDAKRMVVDSLGAIYAQFAHVRSVRQALHNFITTVGRLGVTVLLTAERQEEHGSVTLLGVEEFPVDAVLVLRHAPEAGRRRRTVEILKMRGAAHHSGEFPFSVTAESRGITVVPLPAIELNQPTSSTRLSMGMEDLDTMFGGGIFKSSIMLVGGPTGTGKTLFSTHFLTADPDERAMLFAFEEGRDQLARNAKGWNLPLAGGLERGTLRIEACYPETATLETHLVRIKALLEQHRPSRVVFDSIAALARGNTSHAMRQFLVALVASCREQQITALLVANTRDLTGGGLVSESDIFSMTDVIVLLRYFEVAGELRHGLRVLKMRGSEKERFMREYRITGQGLELGDIVRDSDENTFLP